MGGCCRRALLPGDCRWRRTNPNPQRQQGTPPGIVQADRDWNRRKQRKGRSSRKSGQDQGIHKMGGWCRRALLPGGKSVWQRTNPNPQRQQGTPPWIVQADRDWNRRKQREGRSSRTFGQDHGIHKMGGCCRRALLPGDVVGGEQSQPAASARDPTVDRAGRPGWEQEVTEGREKQPDFGQDHRMDGISDSVSSVSFCSSLFQPSPGVLPRAVFGQASSVCSEQSQPAASARDPTVEHASRPVWTGSQDGRDF